MPTTVDYSQPRYCWTCRDWTLRLRAIPDVATTWALWVWFCWRCGRQEQP